MATSERRQRPHPFAGLIDVVGEMNQMWDRMLGTGPHDPARSRTHVDTWSPATDIATIPEGLLILVEVPGVDIDDIDVTFVPPMLTISGMYDPEADHGDDSDETSRSYFTRERRSGRFHRDVALPEGIEQDDIAVEMSRGVLRINVRHSGEVPESNRLPVRDLDSTS